MLSTHDEGSKRRQEAVNESVLVACLDLDKKDVTWRKTILNLYVIDIELRFNQDVCKNLFRENVTYNKSTFSSQMLSITKKMISKGTHRNFV